MKSEEIPSEKIRGFWTWFASVAPILADKPETPYLLSELDKQVAALHSKLSWETGPGLNKPWQLVISPSLDRNMRAVTERIVKMAPEIDSWEFHPARQAKEWNYKFEFCTSNRTFVDIDASEWTFILLRYPDGYTEILLKGFNLPDSFTQDDRWHAAAIALEGVLGEDLFLRAVDSFELVNRLEDRFHGKDRPITLLRESVIGPRPSSQAC
jgi:hypothetical protein